MSKIPKARWQCHLLDSIIATQESNQILNQSNQNMFTVQSSRSSVTHARSKELYQYYIPSKK